jgi:HPt (histidine-containing phosphotransfer) domain-containing protein
MNDFVAKPFDRAKLVETIERLTHASAAPEREEPDDSGDALPLFSEEPLVGLADAIPMSEIASMVTELLDTSATRLDLIVQLAAAGDWPKLASQAHDMVSTSGNFGLMRVSHTAREIETACKAGDAAKARGLVGVLKDIAPPSWAAIRTRFLKQAS